MNKIIKFYLIAHSILFLSGCGVGGVSTPAEEDCANPPPSRVGECDAKSSTWDKMKWNEGSWG